MAEMESITRDVDKELKSILAEKTHGVICEIDISKPSRIQQILLAKMKASSKPDLYKDVVIE